MEKKGHEIKTILPGSIAEELGIESGDFLVRINGKEIEDIFDYQYLMEEEFVEVLILSKDGEECLLEIEKEEDEDIGIQFENGLMDEYRSCRNKCIFCFIDQMPEGMRDTLYFKDDDSRLSFLQGNYITLTNMSDHDIQRIIQYHLSPINISFHTTNPELRCMMLHNRFAGEALKKVDLFFEAGIRMNGQIVLCKGVNDGDELERSLNDLYRYVPYLESVSVVPVGLSKFREGLHALQPFNREDAKEVLQIIRKWQQKTYLEHQIHFVHASDEWYILANEEFPEEAVYDGYLQLENGVGMVRLFLDEFQQALVEAKKSIGKVAERVQTELSIVTGMLVYPYIQKAADIMMQEFPQLLIHVYPIQNHFFGEQITVTGLLTGQDIVTQCKGKALGNCLLLPQNILRSSEDVLLDDYTVAELEKALQVPIDIVKSSGYDFVNEVLKRR